ncbi:fructuronate reductase [Pasteurella skyensis]|uniref:Fructuronate reductase n=1 Tax=Phocoenobacter skyensis TaxID=97481 RepID=A0AAJ6NDL2_9PAST|nr:fructuronate reductase [Pasteurella skyensis]MDP8170683.1 fructuronate reductase [Pasteurella skyensis]MDP8174836.1 fructuronate reductase [Pasteurella skyensis]
MNSNTKKARILHLGFGAFHRAHQLVYTNETNQNTNDPWYFYEVNLRTGIPVIKQLKEQDFKFHVLEKSSTQSELKEIDIIADAFHPEISTINTIIEKIAEPQIAIVSLTVTEKGYCIDPVTVKLDLNNTAILQDLQNPTKPTTAIGYIVQGLALRKARGLNGFSVMSCDNLMENGHIAKNAVLGFAEQLDPELAQWIDKNVSFPCTMVDRIVPAVTSETLSEIETKLGYSDPCAIGCEAFRQWVIEDNFIAGRPQWELAGAELVSDVKPFEQMKLRMLNGSHSFLAYLGYLAGYEHISDCMQDQNYQQAALKLMLDEQATTLNMLASIDLTKYAKSLIERYKNQNIKHRTWQIAMDGSQKLPPRMLESIQYHLENGTHFNLLALGVAGWLRYVSGVDEQDEIIDVRDPMKDQTQQIYAKSGLNLTAIDELLKLDNIFPTQLVANKSFVEAVKQAYQSLLDLGAKQSVAIYLQK